MPVERKAAGARRHRGRTKGEDWVDLPAEGRKDPIPELPGDDWLPSTVETWELIWTSPMATQYEPADERGLRRLMGFYDEDDREGLAASALGEVTKLEDRYGLNARARNALGWRIVKPKTQPTPIESAPSAKKRSRPRAVEAK